MSDREISDETVERINNKSVEVARSLIEGNTPSEVMTILGMTCSRLIYCFTRSREDFDELSQVLAKQIKDFVDAEEADGSIRWEKAD